MGLVALECRKCGASLEVDEEADTYTCKYCHTVHERDCSIGAAPTPHNLLALAEKAFARSEFGKAMQFIEQGLAIDSRHRGLLALESRTSAQLELIGQSRTASAEAEQYYWKARFIYTQLQVNKKTLGSNSALAGVFTGEKADIDLAIQYINRSIENCPENPLYLNLKALLLWEGKGNKQAARPLLA